MPTTNYSSGNPIAKSDFYVEFTSANSGGMEIKINSKTEVLHFSKLESTAQNTLNDLKIKYGNLSIIDNGGQYFVLQARIEAVIKAAHLGNTNESLPLFKDHSQYKSSRDRFRRSRLYLPGNQAKLMLNAGIHQPDAIILDLEDSVAPSEKDAARLIVRNALRHLDFFGAERMVRINQGELGLKDLEAIVPHNVHLILIPKVEDASQLKTVDDKIRQIKEECGRKEPVYLMPILESAKGILNSIEIAQAIKNNVAIAIGLEDYTADIGVQRTNQGRESLFARSQVVNAARSVGIQAIDTVFSDVGDEEGLRLSIQEAKELGFDGKGCIHPRQINPIHEEFAPSESEIEKAKKIVLAFDDAERKGLGVVALGSKMIDPPVVKRALHTVNLAIANKLLKKRWKKN
ncbi:MAG: HpcH/HpaI aldolase/citrate lyase family protein [Candidatus Marinimicrobia bacterium]|nr:HpcH/HpaI aldolase/citrate lyase family protein [Candidatus Neomarinimicrobiota bacterium]